LAEHATANPPFAGFPILEDPAYEIYKAPLEYEFNPNTALPANQGRFEYASNVDVANG